MTNSRSRREGGWSYLELIVSMAILTVILGSLFTVQARDFRTVGDALAETRAERAAAARLEALLSGRETPAVGTRTVPAEPALGEALRDLRIEETVRERGPGLLEVEVRVRWRGAGIEERTVVLGTLIAAEVRR